MTDLWITYMPIVFLMLISFLLVSILFIVSYFVGSSTSIVDFEKLSTYECGFEPFTDTQGTFDIKFYLLAMLFMIFDLEIMYILPWVVTFEIVTTFSMYIFIWFSVVLSLAFVYEWLQGALDWH